MSEKIARLSELILKHKQLYYLGRPEVSDFEYDALESQLRSLRPDHPVLNLVGANLSTNKIAHKKKMLSLQKTYVLDDLITWKGEREIISTEKIDGSSCSIIYNQGQLEISKTRGDGEFGENITSKIFLIPDVPQTLLEKKQLEIRGEVYCTQENFHLLTEEMIRLGLEKPNSLRNIVAGLLGRKENIELARFLSFKAFDVLGDMTNIDKESQKFDWLKKQGFQIPDYTLHKSRESIDETLEQTKIFMSEGNYLIDGIVFSYNELSLHRELGETAHHPRYKMAFKFAGESRTTLINNITWQVSRNGVLTPVAEVEPVELSGAKISRVTLHNWGVVKDFNLKAGDEIEIERSGEVIPKFISVVNNNNGEFKMPLNCPSCETATKEIEIRIFCENKNCIGRNLEFTKYFVKSLGIDDLSTQRINEMYEKALIKTPSDLFNLKAQDLIDKLDGYKNKLAQKVVQSILEKSQPSLLTFLVSLGLTGGGKNKCEKLLNGLKIKSIEELCSLDIEKIISVEGFAEKSAQSFLDSLHDNKSFIEELLDAGVKILEPIYNESKGALSEKAFCITGTLTRPRSEIQNWIKSHGGKVVSSVSSKTDYLVCNEQSSSSKYKKALSLEIAIISEETLFSEMI